MKQDIIFYSGILCIALIVGFVFLGLWYQKRVRSASGFLLAGRSVPFWLQASAMIGAAVGGASIAGWTGFGYLGGLGRIWPIIFPAVFIIIFLLFFARRLNYFGRKIDAVTITDFVCARYGESLRLPVAVFSLLRPAILTGMQFLAIAGVLNVAFGLPIWLGVVLSAVAILLYIVTAGQYSAIITQWLQGILQTLGTFVFIYAVFKVLGNPSVCIDMVFSNAADVDGSDLWVNMFSADMSMITVWFLTMGLFYLVDPWIYMFSYIGKSPRQGTNALMMGQFAGLAFGILPVLGGLILFAANRGGIMEVPVGTEIAADGLYSWFVFTHTGVTVGSFIIMGLLMTIISCGSSFAMNGVTIIARDIYQKAIKKDNYTDKEAIFASRVACLIVVLIGIFGALWLPILVPLWSLAQALVISAVLAVVLSAWFWRRSTTAGAVASTVGGGVVAFAWAMYAWFVEGNPGALVHGIHAAHIGLVVSVPLMIIVSLATKAEDKAKSDVTNFKVIGDEMHEKSPDFAGEKDEGLMAYYGAHTPIAKAGWWIMTAIPIVVLFFYATFWLEWFAKPLFWVILIAGFAVFLVFSVVGFFDLKNMISPADANQAPDQKQA